MYAFDEEEPEQQELNKVVDIKTLLPMTMPDEKEMEWYNKTRKLDANDLAAELGPDGFRQWVIENLRKAPVVYRSLSKIRSFRELRHYYPELREPVIDGLLRRGEIMNIIAAPKKGKSYLGLGLSMSVIQRNSSWLGTFPTHQGRVLIIDNELHKETCVDRTRTVAEYLGIPLQYVDQWLDFLPLRGELLDIFKLENELTEVNRGDYKLVVLDALYRFMPPNTDENDNGAMARIFNELDKLAKKMDCAIAVIHHTSKGAQGFKSITDVGAGAGSQSRAADAHLIIRELEDTDTVRLDAVNRSFPPIKPFCIRFEYPCWTLDKNTDPDQLKVTKRERDQKQKMDGKQVIEKMWDKVAEGMTTACTVFEVLERAKAIGVPYVNEFKTRRQIEKWVGNGTLTTVQDSKGKTKKTYINAKASEPKKEAPEEEILPMTDEDTIPEEEMETEVDLGDMDVPT